MVETKTQRRERLRKLRKKHGLGEFKTKRRPVVSRKKKNPNMAKKKKRTRRGGFQMRGTTRRLLGAVTYAAIGEPILDAAASKVGVNVSDDIIKGVAGWLVAQNTTGFISAMGESAVSISAYKFGLQNLKGKFNLLGNSNNNTQQTQQNNVLLVG